MSVYLKKVIETYEVSTDSEAEKLVADNKRDYNVTKSSITYKPAKKDNPDYYVVEIKKEMEEDDFIEV